MCFDRKNIVLVLFVILIFDGNAICNPSYCNRKSHDDVSHEKQGRYGHDYRSKVFYLEVSPILPPLCEAFGDE